MKNSFNEDFIKYCGCDIEEIFNEVKELLPELEIWQLKQSVILDDDKKVLCRSILDDNKKCIGYKISIDAILDTVYKYRLTMLENSILLTKNYFLDGDFIQELYKSELLGVNIKRSVSYQENKRYLKYNESSDITSKSDMVSLREMFQRLKNTSSKTRSDF